MDGLRTASISNHPAYSAQPDKARADRQQGLIDANVQPDLTSQDRLVAATELLELHPEVVINSRQGTGDT